MFGKKKDETIHEALIGKVQSHLIPNEEVLDVARFEHTSYFLTQFRLILMTSTSKKGKNASVKSIYFNSIQSVTYLDMATKKLPYDKLVIQLNGSMVNSRFDLFLPTDFSHKVYNEINTSKAEGK